MPTTSRTEVGLGATGLAPLRNIACRGCGRSVRLSLGAGREAAVETLHIASICTSSPPAISDICSSTAFRVVDRPGRSATELARTVRRDEGLGGRDPAALGARHVREGIVDSGRRGRRRAARRTRGALPRRSRA
jgi:hypothetical protein